MDETATSAQYARMKHIYLQMAASVAATFALGTSAACAQQEESTGDPVELLVEDDSENANWNDQPQTPGTWYYEREGNETFALFGLTIDAPLLIVRCDRSTRLIGIGRFNTAGEDENLMLRVRTETQQSLLTATPKGDVDGLYGVELEASSSLLDAMAITQGRFAVEMEGNAPLFIPAWAEMTRVIEDCR
uniref:hypothetical protein n=1 Tax=uncultured Altererythrobacter sp. TaxID=500840 RepID=UPI0026304B91|nr:hypothetical protein [uncultured Altererythrobacter sp.]